MKDLIYYTVGYSVEYIQVLALSIFSLRKMGYTGDIAILCDESFLPKCVKLIGKNIIYKTFSDSKTPEQASMNKLRIFELPTIDSYERILFIDSDIVVHMYITPIFEKIITPGMLYVYTETKKQEDHLQIYWSLLNYKDNDLEFFKTNSIYVFNAGCFAFKNDNKMKEHFQNIQHMIDNHKGQFFYEQSFMNVYFNKNNQTDRTLFTETNYILPPKENKVYLDCLIHFAGDPGSGKSKYQSMMNYLNRSHLWT